MKLYDELIKERGVTPEQSTEEVRTEHHFSPARQKRSRLKFLVSMLLGTLVIAGVFAYGIFHASAAVTIDARKVPFVLEKTLLTIPHEKLAPKDALHFQAMIVEGQVSREIFGDRLAEVHTKATGKVVFINEYSSKPITLRKGTTLTITPGNKKFLTGEAVTIPGFKTVDGKRVVGTSAPVFITAAAVGSEYNGNGGDFVVAGYTGDKSKKFYAKSSGPITGGESGLLHTVSEASQKEIEDVLQELLAEKLKRQVRAQIPEGFVTFPDFQFMFYNEATLDLKSDTIKFPATLSGTLVIYLFPRDPLSKALAEKAVENGFGGAASGVNYTIPDLSPLVVEQGLALSINSKEIPKEIILRVSGEGVMRAVVDQESIKELLIGKPVGKFEDIFKSFPSITEARFSKFPFWAPYFPNDVSRVKLIVK